MSDSDENYAAQIDDSLSDSSLDIHHPQKLSNNLNLLLRKREFNRPLKKLH